RTAVVRLHAGHAMLGHLDVLVNAVHIRGDDRRIGGRVLHLFATPNRLATILVERDNGAVFAAGRTEDFVAIDQRRFAKTPDGHELAAKILAETLLPDLAAVFGVQAMQIAAAADQVETIAIH